MIGRAVGGGKQMAFPQLRGAWMGLSGQNNKCGNAIKQARHFHRTTASSQKKPWSQARGSAGAAPARRRSMPMLLPVCPQIWAPITSPRQYRAGRVGQHAPVLREDVDEALRGVVALKDDVFAVPRGRRLEPLLHAYCGGSPGAWAARAGEQAVSEAQQHSTQGPLQGSCQSRPPCRDRRCSG